MVSFYFYFHKAKTMFIIIEKDQTELDHVMSIVRPISQEDCQQWRQNPLRNPQT